MSHQLTFADSEFNNKRRKTRKEIFLSRMNDLMPWDQLEAVIEPFYPKGFAIDQLTEQDIADTQMLINFRPRKSLNYLTPIEVLLNKRVSLIAAI